MNHLKTLKGHGEFKRAVMSEISNVRSGTAFARLGCKFGLYPAGGGPPGGHFGFRLVSLLGAILLACLRAEACVACKRWAWQVPFWPYGLPAFKGMQLDCRSFRY